MKLDLENLSFLCPPVNQSATSQRLANELVACRTEIKYLKNNYQLIN